MFIKEYLTAVHCYNRWVIKYHVFKYILYKYFWRFYLVRQIFGLRKGEQSLLTGLN